MDRYQIQRGVKLPEEVVEEKPTNIEGEITIDLFGKMFKGSLYNYNCYHNGAAVVESVSVRFEVSYLSLTFKEESTFKRLVGHRVSFYVGSKRKTLVVQDLNYSDSNYGMKVFSLTGVIDITGY